MERKKLSTPEHSDKARRIARIRGLGQSQIREMMRLALDAGAINMAQGAPDFSAPPEVKAAAIDAIEQDHNQYSVTWGLTELREAVAGILQRRYDMHADPEEQVTITVGVTEAVVAALLATIEPGEEVLVMEPAHENYVPAIRFAGGIPRYVPLRPPHFRLEREGLEKAVTSQTRAVIVNTPHNPSGRVFTPDELRAVAEVASAQDLLVITDEIYDQILYDAAKHIPPATLPEMAGRTITTGGISKTYAVTGWRLGYVVAPSHLSDLIRTVHDFLVICAPTPFQRAALTALAMPESYYARVREEYRQRRDLMMSILAESGFSANPPEGSYYVLADFSGWKFEGSAEDFARFLITDVGVAVVPGTWFYYSDATLGNRLVRFVFAKRLETLAEVGRRLQKGLLRWRTGGKM
jgi:aminotransferase